MPALQWLAFGPFQLDLQDERLWRGADVLPVRPKTLTVLRALVAQAGQLVTRDALFATVWPETVVSESDTLSLRERAGVRESQVWALYGCGRQTEFLYNWRIPLWFL